MKLNLKKVAFATTAAISFSLTATVPAIAADVTYTAATAPATTAALGATYIPVTFGAISANITGACAIVITPTLTAGANTAFGEAVETGSQLTTTAGWAWTATGTGAITLTATANGAGATKVLTDGKLVGRILITNTVNSASRTITLTTTTNGGVGCTNAAVTSTVVITTAATVDNWSVASDAISSDATAVAQTGTSSASTTFTSGGGTPFTSTLVDAGKIIICNEDGLVGKVATFTSTTVVELAAASPTQTNGVPCSAWWIGTPATTVVKSGVIAGAITGMSVKSGGLAAIYLTGNRTQQTVATTTAKIEANGVSLGTAPLAAKTTDMGIYLPFTAPLTAGTYNTKITVSSAGTLAEATVLDFTLTVSASPTLAPSASTSYMINAGLDGAAATGGTGTAASSTTNAIPRTAVKTVGRSIAQIKVSLFKDDGNTDATANTVSCIVSGVGFCIVNQTPDTYAAATARSATETSSAAVRYVHVGTDGTAGTGTVTVSVTGGVSAVETTLGTHSYTTYGDVAKLEVSTTNGSIGKAATATGGAQAVRLATELTLGLLGNATTMPAFIVKATDSTGRAANAAALPTVTSSNGLAVVSGTCAKDAGYAAVADTDYKSSTNGVGFYNCNFTGAANAVSGSKATLTISIADPADATKTITTTLAVTIGGSVSTETVAFDKTAYAPGEAMVITRTAKDSAGNPVADGSSSPLVSFSKAIGGTAPAAGFYKAGVSASATSSAKSGAFAPTVPGAFSVLATSSATGTPTITAASSVTDANAGLLTQIDALNAKIVALNALIAKIMKKLGVK
jgi:hypothetical protein